MDGANMILVLDEANQVLCDLLDQLGNGKRRALSKAAID